MKKLSIIVLLIVSRNSFTFTNEQNESTQKTMVDVLPESEELATDPQEDSSPDEDVLIPSDDTQEEAIPDDETQETPQEPLTIKEWLEARLFGPVIGRLMEYEWFVDVAVRVKKLIYDRNLDPKLTNLTEEEWLEIFTAAEQGSNPETGNFDNSETEIQKTEV